MGQPARTARDLLFGDLPLEEWAQAGGDGRDEPWRSFVRAQKDAAAGDVRSATEALRKITEEPDLESRHYLEAWYALRTLGTEVPAERAKTVYGVVVEVGMDTGTDIVAAYADHHARYYNFSGAGVVWERPDDSLDAAIDDVLRAGSAVAKAIGPSDKERPGPPKAGEVRISMLTPSGLHFGQAPYGVLANDPMGGPVIAAALTLMQRLMALTAKRERST